MGGGVFTSFDGGKRVILQCFKCFKFYDCTNDSQTTIMVQYGQLNQKLVRNLLCVMGALDTYLHQQGNTSNTHLLIYAIIARAIS